MGASSGPSVVRTLPGVSDMVLGPSEVRTLPGASGVGSGPSTPPWELGGEEAGAAAAEELPKLPLSVSFFHFTCVP